MLEEIPTHLLDDAVVSDRDTLLVDLGISSLVDQLTDGFEVRVAIGDVGLHPAKQVNSTTIELDEDTIVDLAKTEELQDLADLG